VWIEVRRKTKEMASNGRLAELDVPAIGSCSHRSPASSLQHVWFFARRLSRAFLANAQSSATVCDRPLGVCCVFLLCPLEPRIPFRLPCPRPRSGLDSTGLVACIRVRGQPLGVPAPCWPQSAIPLRRKGEGVWAALGQGLPQMRTKRGSTAIKRKILKL